ncbi:MAG TPA: DUF2254 domain-containing protein [Flavobacteriaceae bacterium]|nr:DUF2254 domain-containing protein [Flavobacteriaceae bacterium]
MKKPLFFWNKLKSTFWFVPILIIIVSILLSISSVYIDQIVNYSSEGITRFFFVNNVDSARTILSTISGAMIGVAGTVFSVTLVALTLASSQLGPRLIKKFMYVRLNQVVLGTYISTYLYCLIVLNSVQDYNDNIFIPSMSIFIAIILAIANIVLLIVFIHQIAVSIQADNVISDVSAAISKQTKILFPKEKEKNNCNSNINVEEIKLNYTNTIPLKSVKSGYLQYIDNEALMEIMININGLIVLSKRPGKYLIEDLTFGKLYVNNKIEDDVLTKILSQFVIGKTKSEQQDLEFSINQMVEIAVRALSPGVNDPYTAMVCIDNLTSTMCYLAQIDFPSNYYCDSKNKLRIITSNTNFEGILATSFNQIRQFSSESTAVIIKLMENLITIYQFATKEEYKKAILTHIQMTLNVGKRSINEQRDLDDLLERSKNYIKNEV